MSAETESKRRYGVVNFERRKYPRFSIDLPVEYHRIDSSEKGAGRALNASEGGMLLYLQEKAEFGQRMRIKFFFPSGPELSSIEALVELMWVDFHLEKDWGDYRCGVRFVDISPEDTKRLTGFLKSLTH